jgi:hypothetical protein
LPWVDRIGKEDRQPWLIAADVAEARSYLHKYISRCTRDFLEYQDHQKKSKSFKLLVVSESALSGLVGELTIRGTWGDIGRAETAEKHEREKERGYAMTSIPGSKERRKTCCS